jgi:hypothetical protein
MRNSIFMTDENCIHAQITDKVADIGSKILIAIFCILEAQLRIPFS